MAIQIGSTRLAQPVTLDRAKPQPAGRAMRVDYPLAYPTPGTAFFAFMSTKTAFRMRQAISRTAFFVKFAWLTKFLEPYAPIGIAVIEFDAATVETYVAFNTICVEDTRAGVFWHPVPAAAVDDYASPDCQAKPKECVVF